MQRSFFRRRAVKGITRVFRFYCELKEEYTAGDPAEGGRQDTGKISDLSVRAAKGTVLALSGTE